MVSWRREVVGSIVCVGCCKFKFGVRYDGKFLGLRSNG